MSLCQLTAIGRLGRDPERSGNGPCRFSIATTHAYTKDGEKVEETEWVSVTVWGKQGDSCLKFLKKGREVSVIGRLKTTEYTDKEGNAKRRTECIADRVIFLSGGGKKADEPGDDVSGEPPSGGGYIPADTGSEDIPF
jgi:single-strand DNA-binding protein